MRPLHPPPSNSEKWRLIGIPYTKSNTVVVLVTVTGRGTSQVIVMLITHHLVAEYLGILSYIPWKAAWFISWSRIAFLKHRHLNNYCLLQSYDIPKHWQDWFQWGRFFGLKTSISGLLHLQHHRICGSPGRISHRLTMSTAEWSFSTCLPCDTIE